MKLKMIFIITTFLLVFAFGIYQIFPVKFALNQEDLRNLGKPYYLVEWAQTTASTWIIVGDQDGYYSEAKYVILRGEMPDIINNYEIARGNNIYVCYGEYIREVETPAVEETLSEYQLEGWDILYPIERDSIFPFWPKSYLCQMDINFKK